jgi:hypothetical protein
MKKILLSLIIISICSTLVFAQSNEGSINYYEGVVTATGIGAANPDLPPATARPAALRAAKSDAFRNLLETVKGVYINAETTVENFMLSSDVIHTQVEGVVRNFRVLDQRYMSDGTVEIDVEMPLTGNFSDLVLPEDLEKSEPIAGNVLRCPLCGRPWPPDVPFPEEYKDQLPEQVGKVYTGLVVDARGLGAQPAMAPQILTEDGQEVYGTGFVDREYAVKMGVAGYAKKLDQAQNDERVTDEPFVIEGLEVSGPNKTDLIISQEDATILHSMSENLSFLEKCRVIIVVD